MSPCRPDVAAGRPDRVPESYRLTVIVACIAPWIEQ